MEKYLLVVLSSIVWQMSIANAGDFEVGIKFFEQKKYVKAKQLWQPLANKGDARAQYNLALLLYKKQNKLQTQKADEYLIMSRSSGLVDGYFLSIPGSVIISDIGSLSAEGTRTAEGTSMVKGSGIIEDPLVWLKRQEKSTYTLQLATGKSKKSMETMQNKLISSQELGQPDNLYIQKVEKIEQEKTIVNYILVYGIYKTYQDAKDEADKLPISIQKSSPWIRQFGVIQSIVSNKQKNN